MDLCVFKSQYSKNVLILEYTEFGIVMFVKKNIAYNIASEMSSLNWLVLTYDYIGTALHYYRKGIMYSSNNVIESIYNNSNNQKILEKKLNNELIFKEFCNEYIEITIIYTYLNDNNKIFDKDLEKVVKEIVLIKT